MRILVSFSTVLIVQAGPASENAELNIAIVWAGTTVPSCLVHDGIGTMESRGMLTSVADLRSAARCSTIVVSDRAPATFAAFLPFRLSEPITRMFSALGSSATFCGRSLAGPIRFETSMWLMLPLSFW